MANVKETLVSVAKRLGSIERQETGVQRSKRELTASS